MGKIIANEIKKGDTISIHNIFHKVQELTTVKPGKGGAFIQIETYDLKDKKKHSAKFRSNEKIERIFVNNYFLIYSFMENNNYVFLNKDSGEEKYVPIDFFGNKQLFIPYCTHIILLEDNNEIPIDFELPTSCSIKIQDTTLSSSTKTKHATLENGIVINVPGYMEDNMLIELKLSDNTFLNKINNK